MADRAVSGSATRLVQRILIALSRLGLQVRSEVPISTARGLGAVRLYRGAELTVMGRSATVDVLELPAGTTPLLGVIPLKALGIELDLRNRQLRLLPLEPNDTHLTVL